MMGVLHLGPCHCECIGRSDEELHKDVSGSVKWKKGVQINRPNEALIKKWLVEVL